MGDIDRSGLRLRLYPIEPYFTMIVAFLMKRGSVGGAGSRWRPRASIAAIVARLFFDSAFPKTVWRLLSCGVALNVMKNWLPSVLGPALAIERIPAESWRAVGLNSPPYL